MRMLGALITAVIAAMAFSCAEGRSLPRTILITPDNVEKLAMTMSSTISIEDRAFHFRPGTDNVLLVVPLVGPGELGPDALIQITVGLETTRMNTGTTDEDPHVGITDGTNKNIFWIADKDNYPGWASCFPSPGTHDDKRVPTGTLVSDQVTLLFRPYTKYGACYTAQLGGYVNTARFTQQVKVNAAISLQVERHSTSEQYSYHYIKVEIVP